LLVSYFAIKDSGEGLMEEKLRYHLASHKEYQKRDHMMSNKSQFT